MRTEGQIKQKLKQVMFRHLQKLLRAKVFRKRPDTCKHNQLSSANGPKVWLCYSRDPNVNYRICDTRFEDCLKFALVCPCWETKLSKARVQEDFQILMESGDRGVIASEFPDIAALLWVLGEDVPDVINEVVEDVLMLPDDELEGDGE